MKYKLSEHVSLTEVDDEAVILDLNSGAYYGLNHIGSQLLSELKQGLDADSAIKSISEQYQIPNATVEKDIQELLSELLKQALIEPA